MVENLIVSLWIYNFSYLMSLSTFQNRHRHTQTQVSSQRFQVQTFQKFLPPTLILSFSLSLSLSLMERPSEAEKARTTRRVALAAKNKREGVLCLYPHPPTGHKSLALPPLQHPKPTRSSAPSRPSEVKLALAAVAVDLNVRLRLADMPPTTQELAFRHTRSLLDSSPNTKKPSPTHLAMCLKKVFSELNNQKYHIESRFFESSS